MASSPGAPLPRFPLRVPPKHTFLRFDFPTQLETRKLACNETTKANEKTGCGVATNAHDFGGRPSSRSGNKHPHQIHLLVRDESTSSCTHLVILFLNWDSLKKLK